MDVKGGVDDGELALEIQEFEQLEEAPGQFEQIHVHPIRKVNQKVGSLLRPESDVEGSSGIGLHAFSLLEKAKAVGIAHDAHSGGQAE